MSIAPWPHRVSFVAPVLQLSRTDEPLAMLAAGFLAVLLYENLVRHPVLAVTDVDDRDLDDDGKLLNAEHPRFSEVLAAELHESRRDEVLWFELLLDPSSPLSGRLWSHRVDGQREQYAGSAPDGRLSTLIESALAAWLTARQLPPLARSLEAFTVAELISSIQTASRIVSAMKGAKGVAEVLLASAKKLVVPLFRLADTATDLVLDGRILKVEADNPKALLRTVLARESPLPSLAEIEQIVALAPQWGRPHLAVHGDHLPAAARLRHQSQACILMPRNVFAVDAYAAELRLAHRPEEAWRIARRCSRLVPRFVSAHVSALKSLDDCGRHGEAYQQAQARWRALAGLWQPGKMVAAVEASMRELLWAVAQAAVAVGHLDEAIKLGSDATGDAGGHPTATPRDWAEQVARWRNDPDALVLAAGRDGHYRGEPWRVMSGLGRTRVASAADAARVLEAQIALGQEDLAAWAWARFDGAGLTADPRARLAGAKAFILAGELGRGLDEIQAVALAHPQARLETARNRLLRLAATRPLAEWETVIQAKLSAGALRLARMAARDCADFVPGAGESATVRDALGPWAGKPFDRARLDPLRTALGHSVVTEIDVFFHTLSSPTLETADKLVNGWFKLVYARDATRASDPRAAAQTMYVLAHALGRYLAATALPPTPLAGAYRQIAAEAMLSIARIGVEFLEESLRPFVAALEMVAAGLDAWLLDTWLLRVEQALELDGSRSEHVVRLSRALPIISTHMRGDERVAFEHRLAIELGQDPAAAVEACELYERGVRALGTEEMALAWAAAVHQTRGDAAAIDALWTATRVAPDHGSAYLALGRALLEQGRGTLALEVLTRGIALLPRTRRQPAALELAAVWEAGHTGVPLPAAGALADGIAHMKAGKFDLGARCLAWAHAVDPSDRSARPLATAFARSGRGLDTLAVFASYLPPHDAAIAAAHELTDARRFDLATRLYRLARPGFRTGEEWLLLARAAGAAGEDEASAEAYSRAYQALHGTLDNVDAAAWASGLAAAGNWQACVEVSERLMAGAPGDARNRSLAAHSLARAKFSLGRVAEGLAAARLAVEICPVPEIRKEYNETLQALQRGQKPVVKPHPGAEAWVRSLRSLRGGDVVAAKVRISADASAANSWGTKRAEQVIAGVRGDDELQAPVAVQARALADRLLAESAGQTDVHAVLCRVHALDVREQAHFSPDPMPGLPARTPPTQYEAQLAERRKRAGQ